jgi:hypothetical protein
MIRYQADEGKKRNKKKADKGELLYALANFCIAGKRNW